MESVRRSMLKFGALQWCFWSSYLSFGSFIVYYLSERGYSNSTIGTFLFTMTLMGIVGQSLLGYVCDLTRTVKKVYSISMMILVVVIASFPLYAGHHSMVMLGLALFGFLWFPQQSIIDSWIIESSPVLAQNYGVMRAGGSIGFALLASVFGTLITYVGWNIMFISFSFFAVLSIIVARSLLDADKTSVVADGGVRITPLTLFRNWDYVCLVFIALLVFSGNQMTILYLPVILANVGGTPTHQGIALFIIASSEIPFFFMAKHFVRRFPAKNLILFSLIFFCVRFLFLFFARSPQFVIISGGFNALSFAVFLPTVRYYINQIAPTGLKTSAQSIATGIFLGGGGMLASLIGGRILDSSSVNTMLFVCVLIGLAGVLLHVLWLIISNRRSLSLAKQSNQLIV